MNTDEEDADKKPYKYSKVEPEGSSGRCMSIVVVAAFLCTVLSILLAIFLTIKPKDYCPEGFHCSWHSIPASEFLKDRRCDLLCTTAPCLRSAQFVLSRIDSSKDPCKDFYKFACGRFENESILFPEESEGSHIYQEMETQMLITLKGIIDSITEKPGRKGFSLLLTEALYDNCMNADDTRDVLSKNIWRKMFSENILPPWPLVIKNTRYDLRNLVKMMSSSLFFKVNPFFIVLVPQEESVNRTSKWNFHVQEPNLEDLKTIYKDLHTNNESNIYVRYQLLIRKILTEVGINMTDIENITNETVEFEKVFLKAATRAKKSSELLYRKKQDLRYKKHTHSCQELDHRVKHIKWCRMFRQLLVEYGITNSTNVAITLPAVMDYFEEMGKVFSRFSYREIINYIALKFIMSHLKYMPSPLRDAYYTDQELFPRKNSFRMLLTRWQQCVDIVSEFLWMPLEREYLKQIFHEGKNARVRYVARKIKETYLSSVDEMSWLKDFVPGKNLKEMIQRIDVKIGLSDLLTHADNSAVDRYFQKYTHLDSKHVGERKNLLVMDILRLKALIVKSPLSDKREIRILDKFGSFTVSNKNFAKNEIGIPYGMLDFPMFLPGRPMYVEYATFGSYIFNYMTIHLLSDEAAQNSSLLAFSKPAKCLEEKFDSSNRGKTEFKVNFPDETKLLFYFSNFLATLGSFQAYKTYLKENGEEKGLPGLPLTNEQLFFIANAQLNCEKFTEKGYADYPHEFVIPARHRVNLLLANSKEFSEAFRCPCNSPMNPKEKCCILGDGNLSHDCR